jgi:hypothetical protein
MQKRRNLAPGLGTILAAALLVLSAPLAASAVEGKYADQVVANNTLLASTVRADGLIGGRSTVYATTSSLYAVIQTRSGSTYAVLYSGQASNGGWANISHPRVLNSWSSCYWYSTSGTSGSLHLDCRRSW